MAQKSRQDRRDRGLSLAPLNLREALDALLRVKPDDEPPKKVRPKAGDEKAGDEPER